MVEVGAIVFSLVTTGIIFLALSGGMLAGSSEDWKSSSAVAASQIINEPVGCKSNPKEELVVVSNPLFQVVSSVIKENPIACFVLMTGQTLSKSLSVFTLLTSLDSEVDCRLKRCDESGVAGIPFIEIFMLIGIIMLAYVVVRMGLFGGD